MTCEKTNNQNNKQTDKHREIGESVEYDDYISHHYSRYDTESSNNITDYDESMDTSM